MTEDIYLNPEILLDFMTLENEADLQMFSLRNVLFVCFLEGKSLEYIWHAFIKCSSSYYIGYQSIVRVD